MENDSKPGEVTTKNRKFITNISHEFKEFISRGSVVDLAVGVIIGGAFGKIVSSLVNDIIMPLIGVILGGLNLTMLTINIGSARIAYGIFVQNVIDFLIIAASIFIFIKIINKLNRRSVNKSITKKEDKQITLLKEIRDELKKNR